MLEDDNELFDDDELEDADDWLEAEVVDCDDDDD